MVKHSASVIAKAGALVGTLDILSAFLYYFLVTGDTNVFTVLKVVASGVFGKAAFAGGMPMMIAGLLLHSFIAFAFTLFFFWLYPKVPVFSKNRIVTGCVYGVFVWLVMNLVVVPLSNVPDRPFSAVNALINAAILVGCIDIPLSFMANSFYKTTSPGGTPN